MYSSQAECAKDYGNRIKDLRYLFFVQSFGDKDLEVPRNFPSAERILTVTKIDSEARYI